jgi:PAS domain-containing protein
VIRDVSDEARMQQTEAVRSAVREIFEQIPMAVSLLRGPEHQVEIMNAAARQLLGGRDMEGRSVRSALPELEGQGLFELLDQVYSTGKPFEGQGGRRPVRQARRRARCTTRASTSSTSRCSTPPAACRGC